MCEMTKLSRRTLESDLWQRYTLNDAFRNSLTVCFINLFLFEKNCRTPFIPKLISMIYSTLTRDRKYSVILTVSPNEQKLGNTPGVNKYLGNTTEPNESAFKLEPTCTQNSSFCNGDLLSCYIQVKDYPTVNKQITSQLAI
jgi:hypothetical protein